MPNRMSGAPAGQAINVLIVDDNKTYRNAFRRNLMMQNYEVCEAENADEALRVIKAERPHVLITDLQMRTHAEGLDLIRQVKALYPLLPMIMISGVGTFEEGAEASTLGALAVIHKSRIEDEIDSLYRHINTAYEVYRRNLFALEQIQSIRARDLADIRKEEMERLEGLISSTDHNDLIRTEAFDTLQYLNEEENRKEAAETVRQIMTQDQAETVLRKVEGILGAELPAYQKLEPESREALLNAEFLFQQQAILEGNIDFSRNIGFSYCFSVENEAKARLRKRLSRFLSSKSTPSLVDQMLDGRRRGLNLYFHQYLFHNQKGYDLEITMDNVKIVLQRMVEHGPRYKPDGLKALGILVMCFGREYDFVGNNGQRVFIQNPLGLKGLEEEKDVMRFCELLINLQHYRNPYIHPEINDMAKLSKIREAALVCLRVICQLV